MTNKEGDKKGDKRKQKGDKVDTMTNKGTKGDRRETRRDTQGDRRETRRTQ